VTLTERIKKAMAAEAVVKEAASAPAEPPAETIETTAPQQDSPESDDKWDANDFVGEQPDPDSGEEAAPETSAPESSEGGLEDFEDPFTDAFISTDAETSAETEEKDELPQTPSEPVALVPEPTPEPTPEQDSTEEVLNKEVTAEEFKILTPAIAEKEDIIGDLAAEDVYGHSSTIEPFGDSETTQDDSKPKVELDKTAEIGPLGGLAALDDTEPTSTEPHPLEAPLEEKPSEATEPQDTTSVESALKAVLSAEVSKERIEEIIREVAQKVIEEIAWEVVPELTDQFIKTEIVGKIKNALGKVE
jgi:hypothetical protein